MDTNAFKLGDCIGNKTAVVFDELIEIATNNYGKVYKVTETSDVVNYCWETTDNIVWMNIVDTDRIKAYRVLDWVKEHVKTHGWDLPGDETNIHAQYLFTHRKIYRKFHSVCYDKTKNKISISEFQAGYGWSFTKKRLYPYSHNIPLLCISDKIYSFALVRTGPRRWSYKVRLYHGRLFRPELTEYLVYLLNCHKSVLELWMPYEYMRNAPSISDAINEYIDIDASYYFKLKDTEYNWLLNYSPVKSSRENQKLLRKVLAIVRFRSKFKRNISQTDLIDTTFSFVYGKRFEDINYNRSLLFPIIV